MRSAAGLTSSPVVWARVADAAGSGGWSGDELHVLGPLVARCDGRQVDLGTTRRAALLARLAVSRHSVSPVRLAEDVWGSADATALGAVRVTIKRLRDLLGAAAIVHDQHGYRVERTVLAVDADRFGSLVDMARDGALAMRLGRLDEALALWSGPAYAGLVEYDAIAGEATRLDELREYAIDERFDLRVRLGAGPELVAELEQAVAAAPQRERRCASLVTALYRSGRQSDALVVAATARGSAARRARPVAVTGVERLAAQGAEPRAVAVDGAADRRAGRGAR